MCNVLIQHPLATQTYIIQTFLIYNRRAGVSTPSYTQNALKSLILCIFSLMKYHLAYFYARKEEIKSKNFCISKNF